MKNAGKFIAMLIRRWGSKTPRRAKILSVIITIAGGVALILLSIGGFSLWVTIPVGLVAAISTAYEQAKDTSNETIIQETKKVFQVQHK